MELSEIKGVGEATEATLSDAGVGSVQELAEADPEDLTEAGLSASRAEEFVNKAKRNTVIIQSGSEVQTEYDQRGWRTTGMEALDDILGGGIREGHIAGVTGRAGTGKTQIAFQALIAAVEDTGLPGIYIETERDRFDPDRLKSLAEDESTVEDDIYRLRAYDLDKQRESYTAVAERFDEVAIVVVDSFTARFRLAEEFEGRASLTDRNSEMVRHLNRVEEMVHQLSTPALLTLQVMGNPSAYGSNEATWGGSLMDHTLTYKVKLKPAHGDFKEAQLRGHPAQSDDEVIYIIGDESVDAHHQDN